MKIVIFVILLLNFLLAIDMNSLLLIESKLYPKIIKLNKEYEEKKTIKIAVLYDSKSKKYAHKLKELMKSYIVVPINVNRKIPLDFDVYILGTNIEKNLVGKLINSRKLIFALYPNDVSNAMIGIFIGVKVVPLINPKLLKLAKIQLNPIIFKVAKIYEK
ncbi:hypothetical protein JCM11957_04700 [Caminibacter profundus]